MDFFWNQKKKNEDEEEGLIYMGTPTTAFWQQEHTVKFSAEIDSYQPEELKKLIVSMIDDAVQEDSQWKKFGKAALLKLADAIPMESVEKSLQFVTASKPLHSLICSTLNRKLNVWLNDGKESEDEDWIRVKIKSIRYQKQELYDMMLQIELEELDVDQLFDKVLCDLWDGADKKAKQKGAEGLSKSQGIIYATLLSLNQDISKEQKYRLIQSLLVWANENKVISRVIDALIDQDDEIARALGPLELRVGDICLDW